MRNRRVVLIILIILSILGLSGILAVRLFLSPRLIEFSPESGSIQVPADSQLRITFNKPLSLDDIETYLSIEPNQSGSYTWEDNTLVFTPDTPWPSGQTIKVEIRKGAPARGFFNFKLRETISWQFQISEVRLAYLWPSDAPADLFTLNPVNGDVIQLTQGAGIVDFSLDHAGKTIYFSANDTPSGSRLFRLDLTRLKDPTDAPLTPEPLLICPTATCRLPQASPNGRWLAYERTPLQESGEPEHSSVWLLSLQDQQLRQIGSANSSTSHPSWSSMGWLAFFDQEAQGYIVYNPTDGQQFLLPNQTGQPGVWQPDGLVFLASEVIIESIGLLEPVSSSHLISYELATTADRLVSQSDLSQAYDLEDSDPAISPDSSQIAFSRRYLDPIRWTPGRQFWMMQADGSQSEALFEDPALTHSNYVWNPLGTQIAFVRFSPTTLTQPPALWLIDADGQNPIQLVIGGYAPKWIP